MATNESFNNILKRYTPYEMFYEELKRRNWFINTVKKKTDWFGGTMEIPLEGGEASSLSWGSLPATGDVAEGTYLLATLTNSDLKELWGTMKFHNKDLKRHSNMKQSYLQLLPGRIKQFTDRMSERVSLTYFGDGSMAKATGNGAVGGTIAVDRPYLFTIGEKVVVKDDDTAAVSGYVTAIDRNTKVLKIETTRSGGAAVDLSLFTAAANAKIYLPNATTDGPKTLASILLSAANGGDSAYMGYTKSVYPVLQALNVDGSGFTATTLLQDLYEAYYEVLDQGAGSLNKKMVIPLSFMKHISSALELNRDFSVKDRTTAHGFRSVSLEGPDGVCDIIAIRDCAVDKAFILDMDSISLVGNSFFKRDVDANGNEFHVEREATGRVNYVDTAFEAALVVRGCSHQGIIHGIPSL